MLLSSEIEVGKVYVYGMDSTFDSLTYTAEIKEVKGSTVLIESQQTKEIDEVGPHMLTTIERAKEMHKAYEKEYEKIESDVSELDGHAQWKVKREYKRLEKALEYIGDDK